jgi:hypothetical protein
MLETIPKMLPRIEKYNILPRKCNSLLQNETKSHQNDTFFEKLHRCNRERRRRWKRNLEYLIP